MASPKKTSATGFLNIKALTALPRTLVQMLHRKREGPAIEIAGPARAVPGTPYACNDKTTEDLEADEELAQGLRKIFLSWRDVQPQEKPQKLVYLLETPYDHWQKLDLDALNEDDVKKVTLLDLYSREYGFHVGFGEAVFYEEGYGLRMDGGYRCNRSGGRYGGPVCGHYGHDYLDPCFGTGYGQHGLDSSDSESGSEGEWYDPYLHSRDEVEMEEVHETKLTLVNLVGLDGKNLADAVSLIARLEAMPEDLQKKLKTRGYTKQKYSANQCSTLKRWYYGKVLLIWPKRHHFDILHGSDALKCACEALAASISAQPTSEARDLVEMMLLRTDVRQNGDVVKNVCHAAILWGDADLWVRAVRACKADHAISELGCENVVAAIGAFGFDAIKECVERALKQDPQYSSALELLQTLEDKAAGEDDSALFAFTEDWAPQWRLKVVGALKNPGVDEVETIVSAGLSVGGTTVLEKTIIPALKMTAEPTFMFVLSEKVHAAEGIAPGVKKRIVKDLVVFALSQTKLYDTMDDAETLRLAETAIKACLVTGNEACVAELAKRLVDFSGLDEAAVQQHSRYVLLPLAGAISKLAGDSPRAKAVKAVKTICDTAVTQFLRGLSASGAKVDTKDVQTLLDAARMCGMSISNIVEKLLPLNLAGSILEDFIEELNKRRSAGTVDGIDVALTALVHKYAHVAQIKGGTVYWYFGIPPTVAQSIGCCVRAGVPEAGLTIIERVLEQHPAEEGYQPAKRFNGEVHCERISGIQQGLKVTKHASLLASSQWWTWKEEANTFLNSLTEKTSEEDIEVVFGEDYVRIMQTIRGTAVPSTSSALKWPEDSAPGASGDSNGPPAAKRRKI
ncbi:uncharacterized protein TRAVEDRAFT_41514 [Trametes versicolor FP-101664 SS1]|uniref:uncharacterized protein n=1 Tax=Trametes versicolor (strain FP-101664) TaxID=717944 RepID=UPI0004622071|nr:uncharacterized protein TRAVEDRAFT_41514 [Trametes versicolor FP-101664 SS1]EIW64097.1 hypothetical protein TRAVEDRAFT_41514 [Trametes versicolor FP-101664 SS1]